MQQAGEFSTKLEFSRHHPQGTLTLRSFLCSAEARLTHLGPTLVKDRQRFRIQGQLQESGICSQTRRFGCEQHTASFSWEIAGIVSQLFRFQPSSLQGTKIPAPSVWNEGKWFVGWAFLISTLNWKPPPAIAYSIKIYAICWTNRFTGALTCLVLLTRHNCCIL